MRLSAASVAVVSCCLGMALPARASRLELEGGAGSSSGASAAPAVTGRVGADFRDHLTLSLRVVGLGSARESGLQGSIDALTQGFSAWAALGEVRAHTSGTFQLSVAAGLGLGLTPGTLCASHGADSVCGNLSPYEQAGVGARLFLGDLFISADASLQLWNGWSGNASAPELVSPVPGRVSSLLMLGVGGRANLF